MNKNEAYKLELLDEFIDNKIDELHDLSESYDFFLRRLNTFVTDYSKKVNEFTNTINKQVEEMHKSIDAFKTVYSDSIEELKAKSKNTLAKNEEFDGEITKELQEELNRKLTSEIDKLKNLSNKTLEDYLNEYKKAADNIGKVNQRLNKLKERTFN